MRSLHDLKVSIAPSPLQTALEAKGEKRSPSTGPGGPDHVADGATDPPPFGAGVGRGPSRASKGALQGLAQLFLPLPTVSIRGKVCSAALSATPVGIGIAGSCSFENIGSHATRVVSGHIVREGSL